MSSQQHGQEKEGKGTGKAPPSPITSRKSARRHPRAEAIALKPAEGKTYADILGGIRSKVDLTKCDMGVKAIGKTWSGEVLIELIKPTTERSET